MELVNPPRIPLTSLELSLHIFFPAASLGRAVGAM
jgi:hypothetical protein